MGNFYTNLIVKTPAHAEVVACLNDAKMEAYVAASVAGCTVVFLAMQTSWDAAPLLSSKLQCVVLLVGNYDDSILFYKLHDAGETVDEYVSAPAVDWPSGPKPGNPERLCTAIGRPQATPAVGTLLQRLTYTQSDWFSAVERHWELSKLLGLPEFSVGMGYDYIENGEMPEGEGFDPGGMVKTG